MFILFYLTAICISGSLKNYDRKYAVNVINEYHLPLIKVFTVNNGYLPLIKIFTVNRIICR